DSSVARLFVLEKDLDEGLALFAEVLAEASFPEEEVEKSRRRHIDLLTEQRSEPDFLARERLLDRLYPGHPYGRLTATEDGLSALTREDVERHYRRHCTLTGATLIMVGAAPPERLLAAAARALGGASRTAKNGIPPMPPAPIVRDFTGHLVNRPGSVQT